MEILRTKSRLEVVANIAILVTVVVFLAFMGRQEYERRHPAAPPAQASLVGQTITLPGIHFLPQSKTLILAISTTCHFCQDSEPFYKQLAAGNKGQMKIIAPSRCRKPEAMYRIHRGVRRGVSSQMNSIGVGGTPTVLLVDGNGKVQQAWVGKLSNQGQQQVQSALM